MLLWPEVEELITSNQLTREQAEHLTDEVTDEAAFALFCVHSSPRER